MIKTENRPFMTIPEAAKEFNFPLTTLKALVKQGSFPVIRVGRRSYIMRDVFEKFLAGGGVANEQ